MTGRMGSKISNFFDKNFVTVLIAPFVFIIAVSSVVPLIMVFVESFYIDRPGVFKFTGLNNYILILTDNAFYNDLYNTVKYSLFSSLFSFVIALGVALILNKNIRAQGIFRVWSLYPWAVPPVVAGFMFKWFFNEVYGAGNDLVIKLGIKGIQWLSNPKTAMGVLIACDTWIRIPFVLIILLAGLQTVPEELYEAAEIDGASPVKLFRYITLPFLISPIRVAMLVVTMFSFRMIDIMMVLTGGAPGRATHLFAAYIYEKGFRFLQFGVSSAASVIMILLTLVIVALYTTLLRSKVENI